MLKIKLFFFSHIHVEKKKAFLECNLCLLLFPSTEYLKSHMKNVHNKKIARN